MTIVHYAACWVTLNDSCDEYTVFFPFFLLPNYTHSYK